MRHFDFSQAHRTLVAAGNRHHLVAGDQLFDGGPAFFRDALVVFIDDLQGTAQYAALVVVDLGDDFDAVLDLGALNDRAGRRLGDPDAHAHGVAAPPGASADATEEERRG